MASQDVPGVVRRIEPKTAPAPLVFDSPHSGLLFPDDFQPAIALEVCERVADWFVDDLFAGCLDHGATMVEAQFRRAYIDPNRSERDLDVSMVHGDWPEPVDTTEKTKRGASLIWRVIDGETAIYDRKLSPDEVRRRIETYWRPYHATLEAALDSVHARFGRVFHVNCHSMPEWGDARWGDEGRRRADFIVGTRDGATAGQAFTDVVVESLRASGYSVTVNDKFKGVELIRRYADPARGREAVQIEVNRGIYMDEAAISRNERYAGTKAALTRMAETLARFALDRAA